MIDPPETFQREKRRTYQRKTQKTSTGTQTKLFNLLPSILVRTANKRGEGDDEAWRLLPLVGFRVCICMRAAILNYYAGRGGDEGEQWRRSCSLYNRFISTCRIQGRNKDSRMVTCINNEARGVD